MLLGSLSTVFEGRNNQGHLQEQQLDSLKLLGSEPREGIACQFVCLSMESDKFLSPDKNFIYHFQFFHVVYVCISWVLSYLLY